MSRNEQWASKLGLVLAMAGNAVGLGNFLRFPAQAAKNGGGAFLIPYLVSFVVMGLPLLWVEWAMGRYGGIHGHHSTPGMFESMGRARSGSTSACSASSRTSASRRTTCYIESWSSPTSVYSLHRRRSAWTTASEFFARLTGETAQSDPGGQRAGLVMFVLCIGINVLDPVARPGQGDRAGRQDRHAAADRLRRHPGDPRPDDATRGRTRRCRSEPARRPELRLGAEAATRLTNPTVWLAAAGQIFFTLSIGMGSIHCYASYLRTQRRHRPERGATAGVDERVRAR